MKQNYQPIPCQTLESVHTAHPELAILGAVDKDVAGGV